MSAEGAHPALRWKDVTGLLARMSAEFTTIVDDHLGTDWAENPEIVALTSLRLHPGPTTRQIRERSGLDRRAVNRLVSRLRDDGLVHTSLSSPRDGRAVTVTLTSLGRTRFDALAHDLDTYFDTAVSTATAVEILNQLPGGPTPDHAPRPDALTILESLALTGTQLVATVADMEKPTVLSGRQRAALLRIVTGDGIRPADLTDSLAANPSTVTYVINQLVAKGLVLRHRGSATDGRAVVLSATDAGWQYAHYFDEAIRIHAPQLERTFAAITQPQHLPTLGRL